MVVGGMAGALIGWPTFRLRGHYFALAMLAYPLALLYIFECDEAVRLFRAA